MQCYCLLVAFPPLATPVYDHRHRPLTKPTRFVIRSNPLSILVIRSHQCLANRAYFVLAAHKLRALLGDDRVRVGAFRCGVPRIANGFCESQLNVPEYPTFRAVASGHASELGPSLPQPLLPERTCPAIDLRAVHPSLQPIGPPVSPYVSQRAPSFPRRLDSPCQLHVRAGAAIATTTGADASPQAAYAQGRLCTRVCGRAAAGRVR